MMRAVSKSEWVRARSRQQEGFLLLGVLFMILLITIALAIAAPKIAESIRRDKEQETIQRGKQYARAIRMYYNKFGRYPNTIDQLVKTNDQRFLRKRYLDPMTGKDEWGLRSMQDEPDSDSWGGQNVFDVYSKSEGTGLDGNKYKDW